jgi:hypothetical protein
LNRGFGHIVRIPITKKQRALAAGDDASGPLGAGAIMTFAAPQWLNIVVVNIPFQ